MSKTIVIMGAGAGLGRALARHFAADGDNVVLLGRTLGKVDKVAAEIGPRAMAAGCDVASSPSVTTVARSRLETAQRMLATDQSVKSIAYSLGFASPSSFSYAFRRAVGETPREFRQRELRG